MYIKAKETEISVLFSHEQQNDYLSITDIAKYKNSSDPRIVISNWLSTYSTIDFLAAWESLYNPKFNRMEFHTVRNESGRLVLTAKQWIERMNAIGITSRSGRYGGTYAHSDIAFEFASWISPEFKLYIIKEYQRLKKQEADMQISGWDIKHELSKINYCIHTDAIKEFLITPELTQQEINYKYANEADVLNMALFGKTARQWRDETGIKKKNMRDYATVEQLIILVNLESMNADMIREGIDMSERLKKLRNVAYYQMKSLTNNKSVEKLKNNLSISGNNTHIKQIGGFAMEKFKKYVCKPCGYIYDPADGDRDAHIPIGTEFKDLPDTWVCPLCGVGKEYFEPVEE